MSDIPDQLVLIVPHDAHRVVHLNLVKRVRSEDRLPVLCVRLAEDADPALSVITLQSVARSPVLFQILATPAPVFVGVQHVLRSVLLLIEPAGKVEQ